MDPKLTFRKSEHMGDWWLIERAEHDGRQGLARTEHGLSFYSSARISDADVEGTAEEMRDIAEAIKAGHGAHAKRCAVRLDGDRAFFWSPRNSIREGETSRAEAERLADEILATLAKEPV